MKFIFLLFALLYSLSTFSQMNFNGIWQGIMTRDGAKMNESNIFFLEIATVDKNLTGRSREELNKTDFYVVQKLKGNIVDSITFKFKQYVIEAKKNNPKITWTPIEGKLTFDTLTGYLSGTYTNLTGRKSSGKIIMYRSNATFSNNDMIMLHQSWRDVFIQDLHQKRKAPIIRDWERKNFVFEPIYFDYDKDILKEEYFNYLTDMTRVVLDHTDYALKSLVIPMRMVLISITKIYLLVARRQFKIFLSNKVYLYTNWLSTSKAKHSLLTTTKRKTENNEIVGWILSLFSLRHETLDLRHET